MWKSLSKNAPNSIYFLNKSAHLYPKPGVNIQGRVKCENQFQRQWSWLSIYSKIRPKTPPPTLRQYCVLPKDVKSSLLQNWKIVPSFGNLNGSSKFRLPQQRCFRTSPKHNALPPFVVIILGRLAKVVAMIFGRTVRRWWQKLPQEERAKYAGKVRRNRYIVSGLLGATAFGSFVYYDQHVQTTPYTERKRFLAFTNAQIKSMAELELEGHLAMHEKQIIPAKSGTDAYRRIVKVAEQLLRGNEGLPQLQDLEWTVTVVDADDTINAFVLPCGSIFVFSGLLKLCDSDDQLGIILAHEMAHAIMGHGAEKASFTHLMNLLFIIPLAALWALLPTDITAAVTHWITSTLTEILMELPHSRFIEEEADQVGLILAAQACFDIREAPVVWAKIGLLEKDLAIEWLSTHPSHEKRQAQLEKLLPIGIDTREKCQCPQLPKLDPRLKIQAYHEGVKLYNQERRQNLVVPIRVLNTKA